MLVRTHTSKEPTSTLDEGDSEEILLATAIGTLSDV